MNLKERLAAKSAAIGSTPRPQKADEESPGRPKTAPGQMLASLPHLAEKEKELQSALERIKELEAQGTANAQEIDISTLVEVAGRRRILSAEEYAELKANLAANPLSDPIVYRQLSDGRREIVSGNNRTAIYRELGRPKIWGVPFVGNPEQIELAALFSNLLAPSLPDFEKYRQFLRIQQSQGLSQIDIIRLSGLAQSHVARILSFDKLPPAAKELIAAQPGRLGGTVAAKLAALTQQGRGEEVTTAVQALIENADLTQEKALEMAAPARAKAAAPETDEILIGRRKLCDVQIRSGVIGVRFSGKDGSTKAAHWGEKISAFIRAELEKERNASNLDSDKNQ